MMTLVLSFVMIFTTSFQIPTKAANTDFINWENYYMESNAAIERFFSYYRNSETAEVLFPDFFSGFQLAEDGGLIVYVTDDSNEIKYLISNICLTRQVCFKKVQYSYNYLFNAFEYIQPVVLDSNDIRAITICIPENRVNVYYYDISTSITYELNNYFQECYYALPYISETNIAETTMYPDGNIYSIPDISRNCNSSMPSNTPVRSTYLYYGGSGHIASVWGTVGYLGLSTSGDKILVTHGHHMSIGSTYYYNNTAVGTVTDILGTSNYLDASIITLYSSAVLTNMASWTQTLKRFQSSISTFYSLLSINGDTAFYKGQSHSEEQSGKVYVSYVAGEGYSYHLYDCTSLPWEGDSGAPLYFKTSSSSYELIGIIKGYSGGMGTFCSLAAIKNAYSHYVYLSDSYYY